MIIFGFLQKLYGYPTAHVWTRVASRSLVPGEFWESWHDELRDATEPGLDALTRTLEVLIHATHPLIAADARALETAKKSLIFRREAIELARMEREAEAERELADQDTAREKRERQQRLPIPHYL